MITKTKKRHKILIPDLYFNQEYEDIQNCKLLIIKVFWIVIIYTILRIQYCK